jgi:hypothetical protein
MIATIIGVVIGLLSLVVAFYTCYRKYGKRNIRRRGDGNGDTGNGDSGNRGDIGNGNSESKLEKSVRVSRPWSAP